MTKAVGSPSLLKSQVEKYNEKEDNIYKIKNQYRIVIHRHQEMCKDYLKKFTKS